MFLLSAGWREKDIVHAMSEEGLEMDVPVPPDTGGAREAFFHLLTFAALYTTVISLTVLFFQYINRLFPDIAFENIYYEESLSPIRWSMAAIIVAFPLFLWISRLILRELSEHPERAMSGIRRWLTYLTLFVTAAALAGDVITLVYYLLEGELSVRFLLKVFTILVLAGMTFVYYFLSLKWDPRKQQQKGLHKMFVTLAGALVVLALVWGGYLIGSPSSERDRKIDEQRVTDLQAIQSEIYNIVYDGRPYEQTSPVNPIPRTLEDVAAQALYQRPSIVDPETKLPYEYTVTDSTHFELCATFVHARTQSYNIFWDHAAGRHCYQFDITDQQYR